MPEPHAEIFAPGLCRDEVWLITGGGTGIGLAAARMAGGLGARLVIASRKAAHLEPAADELRAAGVAVLAHPCDIREPDRVAALVTAALDRFGRIDVLVNNAGGQFPSPAELISPRGFEAVVRNNLVGTFNATREVATRAMIPARRGAVVNVIADIYRGFPGMAHTGAARAGVDNLTKTLAVEWARHRIRVNAVAPGVIASSGMAQYPEAIVAQSRKAIPWKRLGTPEETAAAIVFLGSRAASYITGDTLYVDGGSRLWGDLFPIPEPEETA